MLCLAAFGLFFLRKRGGLKIPRIRKSSGKVSLFDPEAERPSMRTEDTAVKRPLLYVRTLLIHFSASDECCYILRTL